MSAIYEPRGAALEYSPLSVNLYRGCGHGCTYCYAPSCLRMNRDEFHDPQPRKGIIAQVEKDVAKLDGDERPVLLCFTCDPYQPIEREHRLTRQAIQIMAGRLNVQVLTKNGPLAMDDLDLFVEAGVAFGQTLLWHDDNLRRQYEPYAASVSERVACFVEAKARGLQTWMSVEPVIVPDEAIKAIEATRGSVDVYKIGKINHDSLLSKSVDWEGFAQRAINAVGETAYYLKNDLWAKLSGDFKAQHPKSTIFHPTPTT